VVFRLDSELGVPGLMAAARSGNITFANAVGNGVADDQAVYAYVPDLIRYYQAEEPILPDVPTYLLWDDEQRAEAMDRIDELVVKPVAESGGYGMCIGPAATDHELAAVRSSRASSRPSPMPLPGSLARFNRTVTNRVTRPLIRHFPYGAVVVHIGRRSAQTYRTPVLAFVMPADRRVLIALTYGRDVDWLKNVLAAGGCTLERAGETMVLSHPIILGGDEATAGLPDLVRRILRVIDVTESLRLDLSTQRTG
jgi:deazaflavin-dependent oxidoreductase (nitroreductase family)